MQKTLSALTTLILSTTLVSGCTKPIKTEHEITKYDLQARLREDYKRPELKGARDQRLAPQEIYVYTQSYLIDLMTEPRYDEPNPIEVGLRTAKQYLEESDNKIIKWTLKKADEIEDEVKKLTTHYFKGWELKIKANGFYVSKEH